MPFTSTTPGLVPHFDVTVHIVLDDFGKAGRIYPRPTRKNTTLGSVVDDLLTGQFNNPVRVIAFNTSEGWSRDVSEDVARDVLRRVQEVSAHSLPVHANSPKHMSTRPNYWAPKAAWHERKGPKRSRRSILRFSPCR